MNNRLLVTIFSDASHCDDVAGFHYWFKSKSKTSHGSGSAAGVLSVCAAELMGILAGVRAATEGHSEGIDFVIQCDSLQALGTLITEARAFSAKSSPIRITPVRKISPLERSLAGEIRKAAGAGKLWLKHVKGHTRQQDARSFLNRKMDAKASIARKAHLLSRP